MCGHRYRISLAQMVEMHRNPSSQFTNLPVHGKSLQSTVSLARQQHFSDSDEHDW